MQKPLILENSQKNLLFPLNVYKFVSKSVDILAKRIWPHCYRDIILMETTGSHGLLGQVTWHAIAWNLKMKRFCCIKKLINLANHNDSSKYRVLSQNSVSESYSYVLAIPKDRTRHLRFSIGKGASINYFDRIYDTSPVGWQVYYISLCIHYIWHLVKPLFVNIDSWDNARRRTAVTLPRLLMIGTTTRQQYTYRKTAVGHCIQNV